MAKGAAARLQAVRALMAQRGYHALLVPRADEFLGEYIPARNERLHWLTGFTGSAGMAVVLAESAAMFVDGRYTVQVRREVTAELFSYHHLIDEPALDWLCAQLPAGTTVACDPRLHHYQWFEQAAQQLTDAGITLETDADNLIDACWTDRPAAELNRALLHDTAFSGESAQSKRQRIAQDVARRGCDAALIFALDSVSWLLNVRGTDMPQLPVLSAAALLLANGDVQLFCDPQVLPEGFAAHVGAGVSVHAAHCLGECVSALSGKKVLVDPLTANAWTHQTLLEVGVTIVSGTDPVILPKACKNAVELRGAANAHRRDAVAVVRFLAWLDGEVAAGRLHDEAVLAEHLLQLRARGEYFHASSFDTISAAGANAALCHYNHRNVTTPAVLPMNSVYLCDSGAQYYDGTTDITRTVAIGDPGAEVCRLFTLVLKGHIALARARFPAGTTGRQLDALARQFLWRAGFDYDHGTGHGVGSFLSVHEGPQRIAKAAADVALQPGMIVSNEPGYYRDGAFGMRCENLVVVRECEQVGAESPMLEFHTLSTVPFDVRLLEAALLGRAELDWLNIYHTRVWEEVSPLLATEDRQWLRQATRPLPVAG